MCSTPDIKNPAPAPAPADESVTNPAKLQIQKPKTGASAGIRGLTIQRKAVK